MKKFMLTLIAGSTLAAANAQHMGDIFVYGSGSYGFTNQTTSNISTDKTHYGSITPGIGYQVSDNWAIGLSLGYGHGNDAPNGVENSKYDNYMAGLFTRYTMYHSNRFFCYGQVTAEYRHVQDKQGIIDPMTETIVNTNGFHVGFFPGLGFHVTPCMAFIANVGGLDYNFDKDDNANVKTTSFAFSFGQQVSAGIQFDFGGKHGHMHGHHEPMDETRRMDSGDDMTPPPPPPSNNQ